MYRIDDPGALTGTVVDVIPDLQFRSLHGSDESLSAIRNPTAVALSADDVLYVGNRGQNSVARFDDLGALIDEGNFNVPSAQLSFGIATTSLVSIDPSGDLWVASIGSGGTSEIVRVTGADQGSGPLSLTPQQRFARATGEQNTFGGSAIFHQR